MYPDISPPTPFHFRINFTIRASRGSKWEILSLMLIPYDHCSINVYGDSARLGTFVNVCQVNNTSCKESPAPHHSTSTNRIDYVLICIHLFIVCDGFMCSEPLLENFDKFMSDKTIGSIVMDSPAACFFFFFFFFFIITGWNGGINVKVLN